MTLPIEWFRSEAAGQQIPLDDSDFQAIAEFVNNARAALALLRPRIADGLEPSGLYHPREPTDR